MRATSVLLLIPPLLVACSGRTTPSDSSPTAAAAPTQIASGATAASSPAPARRDSRLITRAEIDSTRGVSTVWELLMRVRPNFLRDAQRRQMTTSDDTRPQVRVDNADFGTTDALKSLPISGITEIRYLDASEATARFGTRLGRPMIWIQTGRAGR
ncbi:MAG: hypothetical protein ACT4OZ_05515 [Gemmatimonadota bacterium]